MHNIHLQTSSPSTRPGVWLGLWILGLFWIASPYTSDAYATGTSQAEHVVLIVLEGLGNQVIQSNPDSLLAKLAKEGAASWSARSVSPPLTVPAMASLLTGLPIEKHRVTPDWQRYDFARSFLRSPTIFDYMDLAAGKDSAVFFMDERLYQLSRPEIYVDSQICGIAKPNCTPQTVAAYIEDYLHKVTSEGGFGFRLFAIPDLLLVHLPTPAQAGMKFGWDSPAYRQALQSVNEAVAKIIQVYKDHGVLHKTMFLITGLNSPPTLSSGDTNHTDSQAARKLPLSPAIPWIAWGANVKPGYRITQPVSLLDTGATILYALGLETHTEWDSKPITEIFQTVPQKQTTENERFFQ
ncbi:MAG: hypothetical protein D6690_14435 [Nitrospirae bacterium]|nr:MAG: hypothetical protein D6690_14435 [Nitrospirota bacterium]